MENENVNIEVANNEIDSVGITEEFSDCLSDLSINSSEETGFIEDLDEWELNELESTVEDLLHNYLEDNFVKWADPNFIENMVTDVTHLMLQDLKDAGICTEYDESELAEFVEEYAKYVCMNEDIIPRFQPHNLTELHSLIDTEKTEIREKIEWICNQPQLQQRTPEWYEFRHGLITASNIWKAFGSECQQNSLIYEKCQPVAHMGSGYSTNTTSPLHWGVKYEPLTLMIYKERMNQFGGNILVEEFGCIRHAQYACIGASPDGIVTDETSPLYGRMVEIKNIVNRVIDGEPSLAYWIQMQMQLETCNLDECDFVETQIKEYGCAEEFWVDVNNEDCGEDEHNSVGKRGIVLMFLDANYQPIYKFMPLNIPLKKENSGKWVEDTVKEMNEYTLKETQYWYLDIFSCVTVKRNRRWFHSALPIIENLWKTVEEERIGGHHHRAPKKRNMKEGSILQTYIVNRLE